MIMDSVKQKRRKRKPTDKPVSFKGHSVRLGVLECNWGIIAL